MSELSASYHSGDVDTERFAEVLRDLADDIEDGGVIITQEMDYTDVRSDEFVEFGLGLAFGVTVGSRTLGNLAQHLGESR